MKKRLRNILNSLPSVWPENLLPEIRALNNKLSRSIVVLDDDPTGTQTVYDVPVITQWDIRTLADEFQRRSPLFYILTNSRALSKDRAIELANEIGNNLTHAGKIAGRPFLVISRSDSTLRGHYPAEVDALAESAGLSGAPVILAPFFKEGGRYTIDDIHYVQERDQLIPAAETQFAKDSVFGYSSSNLIEWVKEKTGKKIKATSSNLKEWVEEKTCKRIRFSTISSISLSDTRKGGPNRVKEIVSSLNKSGVCIVNAADYRDIEVVCLALLQLEFQGKPFIYRTAASYVRSISGLDSLPLMSRKQLISGQGSGGLIIVGSYVGKTTVQLNFLLEKSNIESIEVSVEKLLSDQADETIRSLSSEIEQKLISGHNVVLFTSRKQVKYKDPVKSLQIGARISDGIVQIVHDLKVRPRYMITKGGIISSDVATKGLGVKRAHVSGQILPGVPVWQLEKSDKFSGMYYVIFPGNVGGPDALLKAFQKLK